MKDDVKELYERLLQEAASSSAILKSMAEHKSLRQGDNPERRTDLYSWPLPEQTIEGQAAATIARLSAENDALVKALRTAASCLEQCAEGVATQNDMQTWADDALKALEGTQHANPS